MRQFIFLIFIFCNWTAHAGPAIIWGPSGSAKVLNKQGGLLLNTASATCATALAGSLRWQSGQLDVCNGTAWTAVSSSSTTRVEFARVHGACGSSPCTLASSSSGVSSITRTSTGYYVINFSPAFSVVPSCACTAQSTTKIKMCTLPFTDDTTSAVQFQIYPIDGTPIADDGFKLVCAGTE